jgi:hypothetical protein
MIRGRNLQVRIKSTSKSLEIFKNFKILFLKRDGWKVQLLSFDLQYSSQSKSICNRNAISNKSCLSYPTLHFLLFDTMEHFIKF